VAKAFAAEDVGTQPQAPMGSDNESKSLLSSAKSGALVQVKVGGNMGGAAIETLHGMVSVAGMYMLALCRHAPCMMPARAPIV